MDDEAFNKNCELYSLGDAAFKKGRYSEARKYFRLSLEAYPEDYDAMWALGNCYDELNRPNKAEEYFRKAIELAEENDLPALNFNLGNSLFDQQKYQLALEAYLRIPKSSDVWQAANRNIALAKESQTPEKAEHNHQFNRPPKRASGRGHGRAY